MRPNFITFRTDPLVARLRNHRLYEYLDTPEGVRAFMQHHVFAVWDFMSLLKGLQRSVTCVDVPWLPNPVDGTLQRFVNEIVVGEESDDVCDPPISHFELYRLAMREAGASTSGIDRFIAHLRGGGSVGVALEEAPPGARHFVMSTFDLVHRGDLPELAGAFAYGREEVIPPMFEALLEHVDAPLLVRYLDRHVELDGGEHGPLARRLVEVACGDDEEAWARARRAAVESLLHRIMLWDCVADAI